MIAALPDVTAKRAALTPDRVAFEELASGRAMTYGALDRAARRAAGALAAAGARAGDRVAILCRNRIEFFVVLFACGKLGAILVPMNWRMPAAELSPLLADCGARLLILGREDEAAGRAAARDACAIITLDGDGPDQLDVLADAAPEPEQRLTWPGSDSWYLLYTSGTTGTPKAVIQTYAMALVNYVNIGRAIDLQNDDATLNFLPLFHTAGINLHTLPTLIAGGRVLVAEKFDVDLVMTLLASGRLDTFFGVPAVYLEISRHPRFDTVDVSRVRSWGCGGAPLPDVLAQLFADRGVRVCNGFGMTETGPTAFLQDPGRALAKIGSVGRPQLLVEARIAADDGVAPDETDGELQIRGPGVTPGYWNRPDATAAAFTDDGWLRTGDIARRDADGDYYIVGRIKEMYISGGENVYPAEIENVLAEHADIIEAAVIGVADDQWGEVGRAYVMLSAGAAVTAAELTGFCRERLAAYKVPRSFVAMDDFPRTAAGKVRKHLLDELEGRTL